MFPSRCDHEEFIRKEAGKAGWPALGFQPLSGALGMLCCISYSHKLCQVSMGGSELPTQNSGGLARYSSSHNSSLAN